MKISAQVAKRTPVILISYEPLGQATALGISVSRPIVRRALSMLATSVHSSLMPQDAKIERLHLKRGIRIPTESYDATPPV